MRPCKNFEMAATDDPEAIILATQRSVLQCLQDVIAGLKIDIKAPGLAWDQIDELLKMMKDKKPEIFTQESEM